MSNDRRFDTREQRIAHVAWRWNTQYSYTCEYLGLGFSRAEIAEGDALGAAMEAEYQNNRCQFGDPAYGSWPASAESPIKDMVRAMTAGDIVLYAGWTANRKAAAEWWNARTREQRAAEYPQRAYYDFSQTWEDMTESMRQSVTDALREAGMLSVPRIPAAAVQAQARAAVKGGSR